MQLIGLLCGHTEMKFVTREHLKGISGNKESHPCPSKKAENATTQESSGNFSVVSEHKRLLRFGFKNATTESENIAILEMQICSVVSESKSKDTESNDNR